MKIKIESTREPTYSKTGLVFRAYLQDGTSLYMGAETKPELVERIKDMYPNAEIVDGSL